MSQARILVVEDEPIVALNLQDRLESLGYTIIGVASAGAEAIRKVNEGRPDLVLMDIILEGDMDGVATAGEIRRRHDIPVIFLTAYADERTLQRAKATAPYGYIVKPFEIKNLHSTIEIVLHRHQLEKKLSRQERWLATILQCIDDAVIVTDPDAQITFMNEAAEALTRWAKPAVIGQNLDDVFHVIDEQNGQVAVPTDWVQAVLQAGTPQYVAENHRLVIDDGWEIQIETRLMPLKDDDSHIIGVVMVFRDVTLQRDVLKQIESTIAEKDILLKEIHHRVKNNLQIIASLLDLQSENVDDRTLHKIFEDSQHRIRSMALIHEELYLSQNTSGIGFAPYINSLISYLYYAYGVSSTLIALQFEIDPTISLRLELAIPCGLIVTELVMNSLKHAFPAGRSGRIRIQFYETKYNGYTLIVSDDGVGLPNSVDLTEAETFGLQLVSLLVRQLEGSLEFDQADKLTSFKISFPKA